MLAQPLAPKAVTPFRCAAAARRLTPGPKSTRYGVPLTTMAVAGPERSGSGSGVPVPSMTTRVAPLERNTGLRRRRAGGRDTSIDPHVGGLDNLRPQRPVFLDADAGFRAGNRDELGALGAKLVLHVRRSQHLPDLALQESR